MNLDQERITKEAELLALRFGCKDDEDKIKLIEADLTDAIILILDHTNQPEMLEPFYYYARQLTVIAYNQAGNEGETSRSEGGVSQTFIDGIPEKLQQGLVNYRLGKVVSYYAPEREGS